MFQFHSSTAVPLWSWPCTSLGFGHFVGGSHVDHNTVTCYRNWCTYVGVFYNIPGSHFMSLRTIMNSDKLMNVS